MIAKRNNYHLYYVMLLNPRFDDTTLTSTLFTLPIDHKREPLATASELKGEGFAIIHESKALELGSLKPWYKRYLPFGSSLCLHAAILTAAIAFASSSISFDDAGKAGDDMGVVMIDFDNAGLAAGNPNPVESQASQIVSEPEPIEEPIKIPEPIEDIDELKPVEDAKIVIPQKQEKPKPIPPKPIVKKEPIKKKEKVQPKKKPPAQVNSLASTKGMGGDAVQSVKGSSHQGSAVAGGGSTNMSAAKALARKVTYPRRAQAMRIEGSVKLKFDVTENGRVDNIRVVSETPSGIFASSVKKDMARWRYQQGKGAINQVITIVFELNGAVKLS